MKVRPGPLVRYLVWDYAVDGELYRAAVRDEPRDYVDLIHCFYRESSDRLIELGRGDFEKYPDEPETCWQRMALALDEIRELENYE